MTSEGGRLLIFWVWEERYALDVQDVAEVLEPGREYPIPRSPRFLRGVANVHGALVPVLDLALYLGHGVTGPGRELLVLNRPETALALAVEHVERIVTSDAVMGEEVVAGELATRRLILADGPARMLSVEPLLAAVEEAIRQ
jgi:chemotaxis signal transduction protein